MIAPYHAYGRMLTPAKITDLLIGLDFDNTLVRYDEVFLTSARSWGLIDDGFSGSKLAIRDFIRLLPDGELSWQRLQGHVYGKGIAAASLFAGADAFLRRCRAEGCRVAIVSHKTEYGHHDPERVNLRKAALDWMAAQGFFRSDGYGISVADVFFESTRAQKLGRIARIRCSCFIDDLEEVLTDPKFPAGIDRILFSGDHVADPGAPYVICPTWQHIEERIFRD